MKKIILLSAVVLALFTTSCGTSQNNNTEAVIVTVDATKFKELSTQAGTILDVRTPEEWAEGTIEGATKINYHDDNFEQQVEKLDKETPVYVYCKSGGRSSSAADILEKKGFKKVYNLDGGITSWKENGFEVAK
ncbi:MAG: rhodanese-like domain-containing protein [Bacteroidetes bacterium]|nr:rhodanese-like domain-containing protein [Bacteroidota bacterium]